MNRRDFINLLGGTAIAAPFSAHAQKSVPVIGFLRAGRPPKSWVEAFQQGLREHEYIDGQNVAVEFRYTGGSADQLPQLAEELIRLKADVILASAAPAAEAAKKATESVPVVFVVANPIEMGLVQSLARPGGNMTGLAENSADLAGKRMELLREMVPTLRRIAVLWDRGNPSNPRQLEEAEVAARTLGIQFEPVPVRGPNEFDSVFTRGADGLLVLNSPLFTTHRAQLVGLAATSRLPVVYGYSEVVEAGGLMSYGSQFPDLYRRAAIYVSKILRGAKAAGLPVEQPTKFELVVNLKTAKALGLTVPASILTRADEVIE